MDQDEQQQAVHEMLQKLSAGIASDTGSDGPICTGWVLVTQWSTTDGQQYVSRYWDDVLPVWQREGLLHYALKNWKEGSE